MALKTIQYVNHLSSLKKAGKACYQAVVRYAGTIGKEEIANRISLLSGYTPYMALCFIDVFLASLEEAFRQGKRIELGDLRGGIGVRGSSSSAKAPFPQSGLRLSPYVSVANELAHCLDGVRAENVTQAVSVTIDSVVDTAHGLVNVLVGGEGVSVQVSGLGLKILTGEGAVEGTGAWIEDKDGMIAEVATVTNSTTTTLDCTIDLPEPGEWYFVVASNGGMGEEFGVSMARRKITVKASLEEGGAA